METKILPPREKVDLWAQVPQYAQRHPWFCPVEPTEEMYNLAAWLDGGGETLIKEIEG